MLVVGRIRRRLAPRRRSRAAWIAIRALPFLLPRHVRLALRLAGAEAVDSRDRALLPFLDEALRVRRAPVLLRRRAIVLEAIGEPSGARGAWLELAARGDEEARRRARLAEGSLIETDPAWLPNLAGEPERIAPVSPVRILHITKSAAPERWSGFTIRTLQNLRAQRIAGLDPVVVTELGWPRLVGVTEVAPVIEFDGLTQYRLDRGPGYDPRRLPVDVRTQDNAEALAGVVHEVRPAILHAHSGYRGGEHALVALALRERFGIPVVYEVRGLFEGVWSREPAMAERSELYRRRLAQETRILQSVDGVVAISEALADEMVERGVARQRITVVPNGIDPVALVAPERDERLRKSLGLDGRFVVGYLGNLDHWREGIDVLITAVADLRSRGRRDVALLVVGDGVGKAGLEAHASRLGVSHMCRFTGRVPHDAVAQYYAQMDLFANPRLDERAARLITPLKPYEAMALGVPVLVSDLPALREIVDPPRRGEVAPPGDARALADAIATLADDPERRVSLVAAGQAWVLADRTWTSNGARYRAAYEAIIGSLG